MKELPDDKQSARMSVLLGLASTKENKEERCPSTQQIALFIEGTLKKKTQKQLLAHMNHCSHCRKIWIETASYLESCPETSEISVTQKIVQNIKDLFSPGRVLTGGVIAGGVSIALLLLTLHPTSTIDQQIDSRYKIITSRANTEVYNTVSSYSLPWDNAVFGFSNRINTEQQKAFGAGLWQAKNDMLNAPPQKLPPKLTPVNQKHWLQTEWANYYQFGRIVFLLWTETQLTTNSKDWLEDEKMMLQFRKKLSQISLQNRQLQGLLLSLDQMIEKLKILQKKPNRAEKKALQRLLEIIMQNFSPGSGK